MLGVGLPGLILVCLAVPIYVIVVRGGRMAPWLASNRTAADGSCYSRRVLSQMMNRLRRQGRITEPSVLARYGFIFFGFSDRALWWEAVVMLRKIGIIATTVFLVGGSDMTVQLELLVVFGILVISLLLQTLFRPHSNQDLFRRAQQHVS